MSHAEKGSSMVWMLAVLMLLLVPALYVLSIGPYAMVYNDTPDPDWAIALYAPLTWIEPAQPLLLWYVRLWVEVTREPQFLPGREWGLSPSQDWLSR